MPLLCHFSVSLVSLTVIVRIFRICIIFGFVSAARSNCFPDLWNINRSRPEMGSSESAKMLLLMDLQDLRELKPWLCSCPASFRTSWSVVDFLFFVVSFLFFFRTALCQKPNSACDIVGRQRGSFADLAGKWTGNLEHQQRGLFLPFCNPACKFDECDGRGTEAIAWIIISHESSSDHILSLLDNRLWEVGGGKK